MAIKDRWARAKGDLADFFGKKKRAVYQGVSALERQLQTGKGVFGNLATSVRGLMDKAGGIRTYVEEKGGIKALARRTGDSIAQSLSDTYKRVIGVYAAFEKAVEEKLFTDGQFDTEKAKAVLGNAAEATRQYGAKAVRTLTGIVERGAEAVRTDYRSFVPTQQEMSEKYAGIGTGYEGVLFKQDYEACLAFSAEAGKRLPNSSRYKKQILSDIKASASADNRELIEFYLRSGQEGKLRTVRKYLAA